MWVIPHFHSPIRIEQDLALRDMSGGFSSSRNELQSECIWCSFSNIWGQPQCGQNPDTSLVLKARHLGGSAFCNFHVDIRLLFSGFMFLLLHFFLAVSILSLLWRNVIIYVTLKLCMYVAVMLYSRSEVRGRQASPSPLWGGAISGREWCENNDIMIMNTILPATRSSAWQEQKHNVINIIHGLEVPEQILP